MTEPAGPPSPDPRLAAVRRVFDQAVALPPAEQGAFVRRVCGSDPALRHEVLALLAAFVKADTKPLAAPAHAALAAVGTSHDEPPRRQIGPYKLLDTLGEGGMGTVYLAEQREPVARRVALKLIKRGMDSKAVLARFEAERRALSLMQHSCIATVLDAGATESGQPYFVMEYVKGIPITDYCDQHQLDLAARIALFQQVCSGVQHAHLKGVMHRDLKPSNVLVTLQDGKPTPKIIDFGLAKATDHHLVDATLFTEQGAMLGTPEYMSPEQAGLGGLDVDTRTDVYSLGVLLYELLVGELPFSRQHLRAAGLLEMQRVIRQEEPQKPSTKVTTLGGLLAACASARRLGGRDLQKRLRGDLDWIVLKAIEKDRTRRYETAQELAADLGRHLAFEPVLASPPSLGYRVQKFVRRYRGQCVAAAVVTVTIVGGAAGVYAQYLRAEANAERVAGLLTEARAEAEKNRVFADVAKLAEAKRLESELYPAFPEKVPAMDAWLRDYGEPLAARLPELEAALVEVRTRAKPSTEEQRKVAREQHARWPELRRMQAQWKDESDPAARQALREMMATLENEIAIAGVEFMEATDDYLHRTLTRLVRELREFLGSGAVPGVRQRLAAGSTISAKTINASRDQWDAVIAAIKASDGITASRQYEHFELAPQLGLVPIGMDPASLLWEFVHLASGKPGTEIPGRDPRTQRLLPTGEMGIVFVLLPGGTLPPGTVDESNANQKSVRVGVRLDPFFLGKYEMTQGQWQRLSGTNPSRSRTENNLSLPVEQLNWFDSEEVLRHEGLVLPSELQWEYAIRAGTTTAWWAGDDEASIRANENLGSASQLLPVGSHTANGFGLFDMGGNLSEWCRDKYGAYGTERPGDGMRAGVGDGSVYRCQRGGSFGTERLGDGRSGHRFFAPPVRGYSFLGLRAARTTRP